MSETLTMANPYEDTAALEAWLKERRTGIGASDAAAVIGESPWKSPLEVYCEKLGIAEDRVDSEAMEWGRLLEPLVADKYQRETKRELSDPGRFTIVRHHALPFMCATLDREVFDPKRGQGLLEIKTTGEQNADDWEGGVPRLPWVQLQHQLAVTDRTWGSLAVLIGGNKFRWMDVDRDQAFIDKLIEDEAAFWKRVQELDPPQPDGSYSSRKILDRLYPRDNGAAIALPGSFIEDDLELLQIKEDLKQLGLRKDEIESRIKAAIGDASVGILPNGVRLSWKAQTRASYVVAESTFRVLRRSAK